ncbi:MAG: cytochrome c maturation protein CcmE [Azoarcus sp.]|jgi:cytochrome c-type biogenesis protein CcmE|nr:cytochrome c maturation protein CcmE [Azoarcus sp.]
MSARQKRLLLVAIGMVLLIGAVALVLSAFRENLVFALTPSDVRAGKAPVGRTVRLGGQVVPGSLAREADGLTVRFVITDTAENVDVHYRGVLPDLFREGRGAVVQGELQADGRFVAKQVLAKHDENYMPPEAAHALEEAHRVTTTVVNP